MASLSNQSTYSSLEPHASSQKEASICSILLRVGEISHATQTPPGRKKKNQIKPKALVLLQKPRPASEEEGTSEKAAAATNGDDAELAQGLRRHQGHHHRQPRQPQLRLQGPPSIPKSPLPKLFFVCLRAPKFGQVHPNPSLLVRWNGAVLLVGARICGF
jgi:hypothetical protein